MKINGVPRPDKHKKLPAKKLPAKHDDGAFCLLLTLTCYHALTIAACVKRWPR